MDALLLTVVNMSITASWLILAVIVIRYLMNTAPKAVHCGLWALVGFRLLCPFSVETDFSLVPSAETFPMDFGPAEHPKIYSGIERVTGMVNSSLDIHYQVNPENSINPMQAWLAVFALIWLAGIAAMMIYAAVSFHLLHRKVVASVRLEGNLWICDEIKTPFILGVFKPRIYLPSNLTDSERHYVIQHENCHLQRRDHWWKILGFLLLAVHWFNPLVWIGYTLFCRDMELACDEGAVKDMELSEKKSYSEVLLACSLPHRRISACPLAFGEIGIKARVKAVLTYKKPTKKMMVAALCVCLLAAGCFLTNPTMDAELDDAVSDAITSTYGAHYEENEFPFEAHTTLATRKHGDLVTVYAIVLAQSYAYDNGDIAVTSGSHVPTAITLKKNEKKGYTMEEYWEAMDGSYYVSSIREKFPLTAWWRAIDTQWYINKHKKICNNNAEAFFAQKEKMNETIAPPPRVLPYTVNSDGTYSSEYSPYKYKYLLELKGSDGNPPRNFKKIVLSNNPNLTFEDFKKSMYSSDSRDQIDTKTAITIDSYEIVN